MTHVQRRPGNPRTVLGAPRLPVPVERQLRRTRPPGWQAEAACLSSGLPPDAWFPRRDVACVPLEVAAVCAGCPVRDACLATALLDGDRDGVWGGLTPRHRAVLRARLLASDEPAVAS